MRQHSHFHDGFWTPNAGENATEVKKAKWHCDVQLARFAQIAEEMEATKRAQEEKRQRGAAELRCSEDFLIYLVAGEHFQ